MLAVYWYGAEEASWQDRKHYACTTKCLLSSSATSSNYSWSYNCPPHRIHISERATTLPGHSKVNLIVMTLPQLQLHVVFWSSATKLSGPKNIPLIDNTTKFGNYMKQAILKWTPQYIKQS
jgi:hypothetical protein